MMTIIYQTREHPHTHGEDLNTHLYMCCFLGTPPYTWGRHMGCCHPPLEVGNTPIHMGKTQVHPRVVISHGEHPHTHGEDSVFALMFTLALGNTPIHMGKTAELTAISTKLSDVSAFSMQFNFLGNAWSTATLINV